jgi:hypothetical protein
MPSIENTLMPRTDETGFILIREGALLPPDLALESEAFLLARTVGRAYPGALRTGVNRILTELRGRKFNSLEITVVVLKRLLVWLFLAFPRTVATFRVA